MSSEAKMLSQSLEECFLSSDIVTSSGECANIVDAVDGLGASLRLLAHSLTAPAAPARDAQGGHVECLTEAAMGTTAGLTSLAEAIRDLAEATPSAASSAEEHQEKSEVYYWWEDPDHPAIRMGLPPVLAKASGDTYEYAIGLRDGHIIHFRGLSCLLHGWIRLEGITEASFAHELPFGRGLEIRITDILWAADSPTRDETHT